MASSWLAPLSHPPADQPSGKSGRREFGRNDPITPGRLADSGLLLLRIEQYLDQLFKCRIRSSIDLFLLYRADGMLHDQHGVIRRAESLPFGFGESFKSMRDHGHGEPAAFLNLDGVVNTPRRARASIAETAQNEVGLGRQLVEILRGRALLRRKLAPLHDAGHANFTT